MLATLNELAQAAHEISVAAGHWPEHEDLFTGQVMTARDEDDELEEIPLPYPERNFPEVLMLVVTEVAEAMEAYRDGHGDKPVLQSWYGAGHKPEGVSSELADIIIRVLDICGAYGIDIAAAVEEKMRYNRTRARLHGRAR